MKLGLLIRTVLNLKPKQIIWLVINRFCKTKHSRFEAPICQLKCFQEVPIPRRQSLRGDNFTFINLNSNFSDWNYVGNGTLFTYNLNYFDFINDGVVCKEETIRWIDKFIHDIPNVTWGLDPYPTALRTINWIKFFSRYPECATKERLDSLFSQIRHLERRLEYHLLGNHLLENAYALFIGSSYFDDGSLKRKAVRLLYSQLEEHL